MSLKRNVSALQRRQNMCISVVDIFSLFNIYYLQSVKINKTGKFIPEIGAFFESISEAQLLNNYHNNVCYYHTTMRMGLSPVSLTHSCAV